MRCDDMPHPHTVLSLSQNYRHTYLKCEYKEAMPTEIVFSILKTKNTSKAPITNYRPPAPYRTVLWFKERIKRKNKVQ